MIKLIASDMDGTLLNNSHVISEENVLAIKKAQENGIKFCIATGRSYEEVEEFLIGNSIRCQCILMNGAEYRDEDGKILEKININKKLASVVITKLEESRLYIRLMTSKGVFTTSTKEEALNSIAVMLQRSESISRDKALEMVKNHKYFTKLNYIENIEKFLQENIEIRKILVAFSDSKSAEAMKKDLNKIEGLAVSSSFSDNIEITDIKAQKGVMLGKVSEKMNIDRSEVMVIGDSFNDYSMFTEFSESVAMGNAISELKEIAKYITETNENNGVSKAINEYISS